MIISVRKKNNECRQATFEFFFELEADDKREAISYNAGRAKIQLGPTSCSFDFPFDVALPHPDLVCMAALKVISPYIGSSVTMDRPVSRWFGEAVKQRYPNIKKINTSDIEPRKTHGEKFAVSFSGGADSLAAANLCPPGTQLILSARKWHPEVGVFEPWYKTDGNIETLNHMAEGFCKICVFSDFEFLSTNGSYCIYPDNYAFTIPAILLADHLGLTGIFVGDVLAAFTNNERAKFSMSRFYEMANYYKVVGLDLDSPVKGVTEIGTEIINRYYGNSENATTCQYGPYQKPCGKCIKCFRKTLIKAYLSGTQPTDLQLRTFNESKAVINFCTKHDGSMYKTLCEVMKDINVEKYEILECIKKYTNVNKDDYCQEIFFFSPYLERCQSNSMQYCINNLLTIFKL